MDALRLRRRMKVGKDEFINLIHLWKVAVDPTPIMQTPPTRKFQNNNNNVDGPHQPHPQKLLLFKYPHPRPPNKTNKQQLRFYPFSSQILIGSIVHPSPIPAFSVNVPPLLHQVRALI